MGHISERRILDYKKKHINALILACKKEDQQAQMELYQLYSQSLYCSAYRIVKNADDALDAVQEGFITAFQKLDQYQGGGSFEGYLHKICDYGKMIIGELYAFHNILNFDYTSNSSIEYIKGGTITADYSGFEIEKAGEIELNADYTSASGWY